MRLCNKHIYIVPAQICTPLYNISLVPLTRQLFKQVKSAWFAGEQFLVRYLQYPMGTCFNRNDEGRNH